MIKNLENEVGKYLEVKSDVVFKALFGREKSKGLLRAFLNSVLDLKIEKQEDIVYLSTERIRQYYNQKVSYLDVFVEVVNNGIKERINIEIQLAEHKNLVNRFLHYLTEIHSSQINKGDSYSIINKTVCLCISDFVLLKDTDSYLTKFTFRDENARELSDTLTFYTLELPKFNKIIEKSTCVNDLWILLLKSNKDEEFIMLKERDEWINEAIKELEDLSINEDLRYEYMLKKKALSTYITDMEVTKEEAIKEGLAQGMEQGIAQGIAQGIVKGRSEAILETARNMKALKVALDIIKKTTGLSESEIKSL